jgi:hypothetical protein
VHLADRGFENVEEVPEVKDNIYWPSFVTIVINIVSLQDSDIVCEMNVIFSGRTLFYRL